MISGLWYAFALVVGAVVGVVMVGPIGRLIFGKRPTN